MSSHSEPAPKKIRTENVGPQLVIHLDLNKTILAVDEVKKYGKTEVVYLEQWKNDEDFLKWAYVKHGPDFGDIFFGGKYAFRKDKAWKEERAPQDKSTLDSEGWIADLKLSKNEPTLIQYAKEYCEADAQRQATMADILAKVS
jgi:predicted Ser/Thr protein kinase